MITVLVNGVQTDIADLTPSGVISMFGGLVIPSGWLLCNGQTVSRSTYAALFAAVGTAYGNGDGSTTFNLPDFRGMFPRGLDTAGVNDPDYSTRTGKNGGNTGGNLGSVQATATKLPTTPFTTPATNTGVESAGHQHTENMGASSSGTGLLAGSNLGNSIATNNLTTPELSQHVHTLPPMNVTGGGDHESRPPNLYVNFIIKT